MWCWSVRQLHFIWWPSEMTTILLTWLACSKLWKGWKNHELRRGEMWDLQGCYKNESRSSPCFLRYVCRRRQVPPQNLQAVRRQRLVKQYYRDFLDVWIKQSQTLEAQWFHKLHRLPSYRESGCLVAVHEKNLFLGSCLRCDERQSAADSPSRDSHSNWSIWMFDYLLVGTGGHLISQWDHCLPYCFQQKSQYFW